MTKADVAKRLANLTNNQDKQEKESVSESTDTEMDSESKHSETTRPYKVGQYVRATYDVDGVDYEARIIEIYEHDEDSCLLQYIGYGNEQIVSLADLLPSWGRKARRLQLSQAADAASMDIEDDANVQDDGGRPNRQKFLNAARGYAANAHSFNGPIGGMLPPPPPMPPMLSELTEDSENLSAMLMAWYMSGYYTGLYQGQKLAKATTNAAMGSGRNKKNNRK